MNNQKGFTFVIAIIGIITLAGAAGVLGYYLIANRQIFLPPLTTSPAACTQEAKLCPDGSYVGHASPNCEFAQCPEASLPPSKPPEPTAEKCPAGTIQTGQTNSIFPRPICEPITTEEKIFLKEGQREGLLLVQKIYPAYVVGLNFREHPLVIDWSQPITLRVGESASNGCTVTLTLIDIQVDDGKEKTAIFVKKTDYKRPCPVCLAENTLVEAPDGQIPVQNLKKGAAIWTVDEFGNKISGTIVKTSKTLTPPTHQMTHIVLKDKREIFVSPGHPIGDGRIFDDLSIGDVLDGSRVTIAEKIKYDRNYTYDILPSGETGFYWVNGILIKSALR